MKKAEIIKWYLRMLFCKNNILIMGVFNVVFVMNALFNNEVLTFNDLIILQFYGHGVGYFNFIDFIGLIIYNGIPIYLFSNFLEMERKDRSIFLNIRLKNKKQWFSSVIFCGIVFIFTYVLVSLCISFIVGMLYGFNNDLSTINVKSLYLLILITKSLELIFYFLVVITCYIYTKNSISGFLLVQSGYFSYFFKSDISKYTPMGMGSLARISEFVGEQGISCLVVVSILLTINIFIYLYLQSGVYKKNFY